MSSSPHPDATQISHRDAARPHPADTGRTNTFQLRRFRGLWLEMEDVHFHHDSAVTLPDHEAHATSESHDTRITGLVVIATALQHAEQHPSQRVLVAGHADTSGQAQYNVTLSQKRADNVLALLRGQKDAWVASCLDQSKVEDYQQILTWIARRFGFPCDPQGVDNNHGSNTSAALVAFKTEFNRPPFNGGLVVNGTVDATTWGAFYEMYDEDLRDQLDADAGGLSALRGRIRFIDSARPGVGCGENFPIEQRGRNNFRSATNRRVEILFFDAGEEPPLNCHPSAGACAPDQCILYRQSPRIFDLHPIPVQPRSFAQLEIVLDGNNDHAADASEPVTDFVRVGLWDHAFNSGSGALENAAGETANFVGADSRRFYFRVRDARASGTVQVRWSTDHEDGSADDAPATRDVTCTETAAGSGVFVSRAMMLVSDAADVAQATDSGLSAGNTGSRNRGQADHRLRRITVNAAHALDNRVVAEYAPGQGRGAAIIARAAVFQRSTEERRRINVHLVNLTAGGTPVLTPARRDLAIRTFNEIYAHCGIFVQLDEITLAAPASCVGWATRYPASPIAADPSCEGFRMLGSDLTASASQLDVINAVRALPSFAANDVYIIYVQELYRPPVPAPSATATLARASGGQAFPDSWTSATNRARGFGFVALASGVNELADVHECTHITTNLFNVAGGHFDLGAAAATSPGNIDGRNLMHRFFLNNTQGVQNPKRLWNDAFTNTVRTPNLAIPAQVDAIRGSRFVHAF